MRFSDIPRGSAQRTGMRPFAAGLIAVLVVGLGTFFAFTKANPFASPYELEAVFANANRVAERSPVRIAGVNVGEVTSVEPLEDGSGYARVTMEIDEQGLPIHKDAQLKVRSRLFLEGNYFVELRPGTPGKPVLASGATIPPQQTAAPVQFNQVLTALQSETREDLRTLLKEYSSALKGPGARGFNQAIKHWEDAYRDGSQVADATRGQEAHDLSRLLRGQGRVFGALSRNPQQLSELVTDLNDTIAGFARQEANLRATVPELRDVLREGRPALISLNSALPSVRRFARDALPGARSSNATLDAQLPFIRQARALISERELRGLARKLQATLPPLTRLNTRTPATLEQYRALASCQNRVLLPFAKEPIPDPSFPWADKQPFFKESSRALVGLSGESRLADANSPYFRVLAGGGATTLVQTGESGQKLFSSALLPLDGVRPAKPPKRPVFRPGVPCETQEPPDLNSTTGVGETAVNPATARLSSKQRAERDDGLEALREYTRDSRAGREAVDPLVDPSVIGKDEKKKKEDEE
ncbi:MAG TPA: MlaD family protein [Thermoleophilaceae bacterium]|nr:MlaD family protein [Thermoleophilaceae bacterium]